MELYLLHVLYCIYCTVLTVLYLLYCTYCSVLSVFTVGYCTCCTCFYSAQDTTVNVTQYNIFVFPKAKQGAKYAYFEPKFENSETVRPFELKICVEIYFGQLYQRSIREVLEIDQSIAINM
jgi:hypothetical protein